MSRIALVDPARAEGKTKQQLAGFESKLGFVPNLTRVLAQAPAALDGYVALSGALGAGRLSAKVREQIALTVAETNLCRYCLGAHAAIGAKVGLTQDEIDAARRATASDPKVAATVRLARAIVTQRGEVSDAELAKARAAGLGDAELVEVVAHVALNLFTNYVNHVARTPVDFPEVAALA
jgi:uncharacterized peroxidase-related enzyme